MDFTVFAFEVTALTRKVEADSAEAAITRFSNRFGRNGARKPLAPNGDFWRARLRSWETGQDAPGRV
jgi:hypothetical protein